MDKILLLNEIPKEFKLERLGSGQNGTCYLTSDKRVFKEYHNDGMDDDITRMLLDLHYDGFTFPEQLVFINEFFKGYLKQYIEGVTLDKISSLTEIKQLVVALKQFESSLMDLSYDRELYVYDLNLHNLIYDGKKIYDIDTDPIAPFDFPITNPYYENIKELANSFNGIFLSDECHNKHLQDLARESMLIGCTRPSLFMNEAIKEMEKEIEIKTISDYKKGLVLLRK